MNYVSIEELCEILNGYAFKSDNYVEEGVRIIRIANVQKGYIEDNTPVFCQYDNLELEKYMLMENDLLISLTGNVGRVALLTKEFLPAALNQRVACLRLKNKEVLKKYLFYCLSANGFEEKCIRSAKGVAQKNMSTEWLKKYKIPLYSSNEQIQIVRSLDFISRTINNRKKQLQKLDELIQARFVELFGDPTINTKKYPLKLLPEIAEYWNGLTYKPDDVADKGTIVLRSSNIQNMTLDFEDIVRVNCKIGEKKYVHENDILMCSRNGSARLVGKVALIKNIEEPMSFGAFMLIIRSAYYPYLMTYFQMPAFRAQIVTGATTTINQITGRMLDNVKLPVPDMYVVNQFADFVNQVNKSKLVIKNLLQIYKHRIQM